MGKGNGVESPITFRTGPANSVERDGLPSWTQKSKLRSGPSQRINKSSDCRWCLATSGAWSQTTCQVVQTTLSKIVLMESSSFCSSPRKSPFTTSSCASRCQVLDLLTMQIASWESSQALKLADRINYVQRSQKNLIIVKKFLEILETMTNPKFQKTLFHRI